MGEWQTIDSAPRGEVILYFPEIVVGAYRQGRLAAMRRIGRVDDYPNRIPTHWMPIPADPVSE